MKALQLMLLVILVTVLFLSYSNAFFSGSIVIGDSHGYAASLFYSFTVASQAFTQRRLTVVEYDIVPAGVRRILWFL
jgi:hypothetical protein